MAEPAPALYRATVLHATGALVAAVVLALVTATVLALEAPVGDPAGVLVACVASVAWAYRGSPPPEEPPAGARVAGTAETRRAAVAFAAAWTAALLAIGAAVSAALGDWTVLAVLPAIVLLGELNLWSGARRFEAANPDLAVVGRLTRRGLRPSSAPSPAPPGGPADRG